MSYNDEQNNIISNMNILFGMKENGNVATTDYSDAMMGNWCDTPLSTAFFSGANIDILQNGLRAGVYHMSNGKYIIDRQNEDELKIIMRSIFLQKSKNIPTGIREQIETLNKNVLDYAVKQVHGEIISYNHYINDISKINLPPEPPKLSRSNNKQLKLKNWF